MESCVQSGSVFLELPPIVDLVGGYYHWYSTKNALVGMAGSFMCQSWKTIEGSPHRQVPMAYGYCSKKTLLFCAGKTRCLFQKHVHCILLAGISS